MVNEFRLVSLELLGVPQHGVQIGEVVVHVIAFVAETTQSPAGELRSLKMKHHSLIQIHMKTHESSFLSTQDEVRVQKLLSQHKVWCYNF